MLVGYLTYWLGIDRRTDRHKLGHRIAAQDYGDNAVVTASTKTIAAFAIEDRVDFRFIDFDPNSGADTLFIERQHTKDADGIVWSRGSRNKRDRDFLFKAKLAWRPGRLYFDALLDVLRTALSELHETYAEDGNSP